MKKEKDYITLFNNFFDKISKEELSSIISQIDGRKYHNITVAEYLDSISSNIDVFSVFNGQAEILTQFECNRDIIPPISCSFSNLEEMSVNVQSFDIEELLSTRENKYQEVTVTPVKEASYSPAGDNYSYRLAA